jgi:hypothetical protein
MKDAAMRPGRMVAQVERARWRRGCGQATGWRRGERGKAGVVVERLEEHEVVVLE